MVRVLFFVDTTQLVGLLLSSHRLLGHESDVFCIAVEGTIVYRFVCGEQDVIICDKYNRDPFFDIAIFQRPTLTECVW